MSAFRLAPRRRPRRPSLTPMIDVVFLLLVFFMVAARFGAEAALPLGTAVSGPATWEGPPRLVRIAPDALRLNGEPVEPAALPAALAALGTPDDAVILAGTGDARLRDVARVLDLLTAAGHSRLILVE